MKTKLLALVLLAGGSMFGQSRFSIGVGVGGYGPGYVPSAPLYAGSVPPCPGPDYIWADGYWRYNGGYRVAPRYDYRRQSFHRDFDRNEYRDGGRDHARGNGFRGR